MNFVEPKRRNQIDPESRLYCFHRVLFLAVVAGARALVAGMAAMGIGCFRTALLRTNNLLTTLRAWIAILSDRAFPRRLRLLDKRHNEIQKRVLLWSILQDAATESLSDVVDS